MLPPSHLHHRLSAQICSALIRTASATRPARLATCQLPQRWQSTLPPLFQQQEDGSEKPLEEKDLFAFSRFRWLSNDHDYSEQRLREFSVPALVGAAVRAAGATTCTKLVKGLEGHSNKIFFLTMDTGKELLIKIPTPLAGPAYFTVASEVATGHFLRTVLGLPVPRILSFSLDARNAIQAEYIIGEKPTGVPVGSLWSSWSKKDIVDFVEHLLLLERRLSAVSFSRHGCIYLKKHLEQRRLPFEELGLKIGQSEASDGSETDSRGVNLKAANLFALGPTVDPTFWEGQRNLMKLNRGPWKTPLDYMKAVGVNERQWAKSHAHPRVDPLRGSLCPESPNSYILLLDKYLELITHLCPKSSLRPTLCHANLSSLNVLLDPQTKKIACITNWQSAQVLPPLFQPTIPLLFRESPEAAGGRTEFAAQAYLQSLEREDEGRFRGLTLPEDRRGIVKLLGLLPGAWTHRRDRLLEMVLAGSARQWEDVVKLRRMETDRTKVEEILPLACPVNFSEDELVQTEQYLHRFQRLVETLDAYRLPHRALGA